MPDFPSPPDSAPGHGLPGNELPARRFVLLRHDLPSGHARGTHWDLMLEAESGLRTWAFPCPFLEAPGDDSDSRGLAETLPDHRRAYLDYEGPVSGERGVVSRVAAGVYHANRREDGSWTIQLEVQGTRGRLRIEPADVNGRCRWQWRAEDEVEGG